jgi:predicted SprT family Zn-dependent metalloprotease
MKKSDIKLRSVSTAPISNTNHRQNMTLKNGSCKHNYVETSSSHDMDGETYTCSKCGDRYRLYYEDMA